MAGRVLYAHGERVAPARILRLGFGGRTWEVQVFPRTDAPGQSAWKLRLVRVQP